MEPRCCASEVARKVATSGRAFKARPDEATFLATSDAATPKLRLHISLLVLLIYFERPDGETELRIIFSPFVALLFLVG